MKPHPYRLLLFAFGGVLFFGLLAWLVAVDSAIVRLDRWVSAGCYQFTIDRPWVLKFFINVTDLGYGLAATLVGTFIIVILLIRREGFRALVWTLVLLTSWQLVPILKEEFLRKRPGLGEAEGWSFPSGHACAAATVYGLLAFLVLRVWHDTRRRWLLAAVSWVLIFLVGLSRIMLGVHFFSDVLAGISLGLAWACCGAAVADAWDRRGRHPLISLAIGTGVTNASQTSDSGASSSITPPRNG